MMVMVRFVIYYFFVLIYRVFRMVVRPKITGDNNYLSSPVITMHQLLTDPLVNHIPRFVDIGCGEGIVGMYARLILKKQVVLYDIQHDFLRMIRMVKRCLLVSNVTVTNDVANYNPRDGVFFCVWTSWSHHNQQKFLNSVTTIVPKGSILITISHALGHPGFTLLKSSKARFAWGQASVYYYKHD